MNKFFCELILLFSLVSCIYSQVEKLSLESIQQNFKSFRYKDVIQLSEELLVKQPNLTEEDLLEVHRMRAISYYSMGEINSSLTAFLDILKINLNFKLDPANTSPKIISFFEEIKSNFMKDREEFSRFQNKIISDSLISLKKQVEESAAFPGAVVRSLILPGWGHLYRGQKVKGWTLGILSVGTLGASIYFFDDSYVKEKAYLNETEMQMIETKYQDYNSAFKKRNIFITSFAAIWLYSQIDILFFSGKNKPGKRTAVIFPKLNFASGSSLELRLKFSF